MAGAFAAPPHLSTASSRPHSERACASGPSSPSAAPPSGGADDVGAASAVASAPSTCACASGYGPQTGGELCASRRRQQRSILHPLVLPALHRLPPVLSSRHTHTLAPLRPVVCLCLPPAAPHSCPPLLCKRQRPSLAACSFSHPRPPVASLQALARLTCSLSSSARSLPRPALNSGTSPTSASDARMLRSSWATRGKSPDANTSSTCKAPPPPCTRARFRRTENSTRPARQLVTPCRGGTRVSAKHCRWCGGPLAREAETASPPAPSPPKGAAAVLLLEVSLRRCGGRPAAPLTHCSRTHLDEHARELGGLL